MSWKDSPSAFVRRFFSLREDQASKEEIKKRILNGGQVRGTNMCILILAIFIASIGLNMNSTAVIIGAMLISPLMGGIMSMGYGLATADLVHFRNALGNFLFQVAVSLVTSTLYFLLSPIHAASSELLARTMPTVWDVLIALFGGLAGIIATTRKDRITNVIPGVAIATALMPPLCTAGYGLATGQWMYFLGALYLFFINTFFICLSSIVVLRLLRVNSKEYETPGLKRRVHVGIAAITIVTILPSIYLGWQTVERNLEQSRYEQFVKEEFNFSSTQVVRSDFNKQERVINIALIGTTIDDSQIDTIEDRISSHGLSGVKLHVTQMEVKQGVTQEQLDSILSQEKDEEEKSTQQIKDLQSKLDETNDLLSLRAQVDDLLKQVESEVMVLYPKVKSAGTATMQYGDGQTQSAVVVSVTQSLTAQERQTLTAWLEARMDIKIRLIETKEPTAAAKTTARTGGKATTASQKR